MHAPFTDAAVGDRPDEFFDDVHFVLHLRRGDRGRPGSEPARSVEREAVARRLHAGDVARARQARRPEPGPGRQAVHAQGRPGSAGRGVGRSPVRRRVLRQVHRGPRGPRLRPALRTRRAGAPQAQRRRGVGRRARSGRRRTRPSRRCPGSGRGGVRRCADPRARRLGHARRSRPGSIRGTSSRTPTGNRSRAPRTGRPRSARTSRAIRCRSSSRAAAPSSEARSRWSRIRRWKSSRSNRLAATLSADQKAFRDGWLGRKSRIPNP